MSHMRIFCLVKKMLPVICAKVRILSIFSKLSIIAPKSEWLYHLKLNMYLRISKYFARLQK